MNRPLSIGMIGLRGIPATHGGVEAAVEGLSTELVRRGHSVTVYGRSAYCEAEVDEYRGVHLRRLPQINTKHLEAVSHTLVASAVALARGEHDVLHLHATGPALFSVLPRLARTACVATVQGLDWRREKWGPVASRVLRMASIRRGNRSARDDRRFALTRARAPGAVSVRSHLHPERDRPVEA